MKINKLILRNIGAYYGLHNEFDLKTSSNKNVVLLGGKNGAGKTTLLESIRIALFGSLAYGFMTDNDVYYNNIRTLLNRTALKNGESNYQIILHFSAVENYESVDYVLNRAWNVKDHKIKESFIVQKAGHFLNTREIDNFQNKIREEIPPRLFELCLFDGEEISRVVSNGQIPDYLNDASKVLFNLDLFVNLEKDLQTYKNQYVQKSDATSDEHQKIEIETHLHNLSSQLLRVTEELKNNQLDSDIIRDNINKLKRDFELHGGLIKETRQELISKTNEIENKRKANSEQIKGFILDLLPFYITKNLLTSVDSQMDQEKIFESFEYVASTLSIEKVNKLSEEIVPNSSSINTEEYSNNLYNGLLELLKPENNNLIHRASFSQRSEIRSLLNKINNVTPEAYHKLFNENAKLLEEAQQLRKAIEENDRSSDFKELLDQIEVNALQLEQKRALSEQQQEQQLQLEEQIKSLKVDLEKVNQRLVDRAKTENSFTMAEKLLNVSQRFRTMQLRKKLDQVEQEARKMIQLLFRKKNYINRIHIDHQTFEINLYAKNQEEIIKERLSAGEKEMLMLSVIWSMFRVSGWKLPFVFDTLLGRLDQDHKKELINQYIPKCGEQVLILSTDSEVTPEQYRQLETIVSQCYTLEYNDAENRTEIKKGHYFNMPERELV